MAPCAYDRRMDEIVVIVQTQNQLEQEHRLLAVTGCQHTLGLVRQIAKGLASLDLIIDRERFVKPSFRIAHDSARKSQSIRMIFAPNADSFASMRS